MDEEKNEDNAVEEMKEEILESTNDGRSRPGRAATTDRRSGRRSGGRVFSPSPAPTATRSDNTNSAPSRGRKRRREELDAGDPTTKQLQSRMASPPIHSRTSRRGSYTPSVTQIVIPEAQSPSKRQKTNDHNHNHNLHSIQQQSVSNTCLFILEEFFSKCK